MSPEDLASYLAALPKGYLRLEIVHDGTTVRLEMAPDAWLSPVEALPGPFSMASPDPLVSRVDALPEDLQHLRDHFPAELLDQVTR